jgi:hypothetical protein
MGGELFGGEKLSNADGEGETLPWMRMSRRCCSSLRPSRRGLTDVYGEEKQELFPGSGLPT